MHIEFDSLVRVCSLVSTFKRYSFVKNQKRKEFSVSA